MNGAAPPPLPSGYDLVAHARLGSTMDEARRLAQSGAAEGTLVWALEQTAGRGRQGRGWSSPPGNLYLSILLRPQGPAIAAAQLGFAAGLALADTLQSALPPGCVVSLKWPNDLLLDGAKVAGILLESQAEIGTGVAWLILGVGCNLASHPEGLPYAATSAAAAGARLSPADCLSGFVARFEPWRRRLQQEGFAPLRAAWLGRAAGLGGPVRARLPRGELTGIFRGLDEEGALLLDGGEGPRRVTAADVFFG